MEPIREAEPWEGYNFSRLEKMAKIVSDGSTLLMAYALSQSKGRWWWWWHPTSITLSLYLKLYYFRYYNSIPNLSQYVYMYDCIIQVSIKHQGLKLEFLPRGQVAPTAWKSRGQLQNGRENKVGKRHFDMFLYSPKGEFRPKKHSPTFVSWLQMASSDRKF